MFLSALLVAGVLFSCENVHYYEESSAESSSVGSQESGDESSRVRENHTAQEWLERQPDAEYGGYTFTIAAPVSEYFVAQSNEELEQTRVNAAVEKRNILVCDKYNIKIAWKLLKTEDYDSTMTAQALSGQQYADLAVSGSPQIALAAQKGALLNLLSLPYFDIGADYLEDAATQSVIGSTAYGLYGSISLSQTFTWCVFYNRDLLEASGCQDPTELYRKGEWTLAKLQEMSEKIASETMEKRTPDISRDTYGYTSYYNDDNFIMMLWQSSGLRALGDSYKTTAALSYNYEKSEAVLSSIASLNESKSKYGASREAAVNAFTGGRIGFFFNRLDFAKTLSTSSVNWSIVPMPKVTSEQKHYFSPLDTYAYGVCAPLSQDNAERTGMILNALCAASVEQIEKGFIDNFVNHYLTDNEGAVMLKKSLTGVCTDPTVIYGSAFSEINKIAAGPVTGVVNDGKDLETAVELGRTAFEKLVKLKFR